MTETWNNSGKIISDYGVAVHQTARKKIYFRHCILRVFMGFSRKPGCSEKSRVQLWLSWSAMSMFSVNDNQQGHIVISLHWAYAFAFMPAVQID